MALNQAQVIGHLGGNPDITTFQDGGKGARFSVATTRKWKDRDTGETKEDTEWHRVSISSGGLVGVVERFLKKGSKVFIQGRLRTRKWQDSSGQDRYTTEIVVGGYDGKLEMLDSRGGREDAPPVQDQGPGPSHDMDDEIPF